MTRSMLVALASCFLAVGCALEGADEPANAGDDASDESVESSEDELVTVAEGDIALTKAVTASALGRARRAEWDAVAADKYAAVRFRARSGDPIVARLTARVPRTAAGAFKVQVRLVDAEGQVRATRSFTRAAGSTKPLVATFPGVRGHGSYRILVRERGLTPVVTSFVMDVEKAGLTDDPFDPNSCTGAPIAMNDYVALRDRRGPFALLPGEGTTAPQALFARKRTCGATGECGPYGAAGPFAPGAESYGRIRLSETFSNDYNGVSLAATAGIGVPYTGYGHVGMMQQELRVTTFLKAGPGGPVASLVPDAPHANFQGTFSPGGPGASSYLRQPRGPVELVATASCTRAVALFDSWERTYGTDVPYEQTELALLVRY